ncbi:hypothetical protein GUITHDRAFT_152449 [Guillardia theta CCMP2712]|uniref:RING-type domain-containing protein n=1 Tax=Guillardia theta (strain CCMP2712) TaxID=905079 RepID=L1JCP4_GUITC|nr:hypothetical protein GUITHDRAFT_152449 [Guillardia theta CCMP2712]EKX46276.1 hypothetical protein GUITHDRAFT_152449 [Guillardia theta CCMP2712]|eukprot:XP_005833256.1 hypothetical protein GUITHDRAFT_152449 [Guillardia theta CCMP2712]
MHEAMQRTVKLVHTPVPTGIGNEANLDEEGVKECLICFGRGIDTILLPCQHSGLCVSCAESVLRRSPSLCPICRMEVCEVLRFVGEESVSITVDNKGDNTLPPDLQAESNQETSRSSPSTELVECSNAEATTRGQQSDDDGERE